MPCLRYGVDSIEQRRRDAGINGFWDRHVGETLPRTIPTPTVSFGFGTSAASTFIRYGVAASFHLLCYRLHPTRNDAGDPGLRVVFPGPCAGRRLGRRRGAERRVGHRCLSEHSERVSMGGRSRPRAFSRSADRPGDVLVFPFWVGQKRGPPSPVTAKYVGRPHPGRAHIGRLIGAFQRSTLRSGSASLAIERNPSLSGIADMCSDSRGIRGTTSETLHYTLDTVREPACAAQQSSGCARQKLHNVNVSVMRGFQKTFG